MGGFHQSGFQAASATGGVSAAAAAAAAFASAATFPHYSIQQGIPYNLYGCVCSLSLLFFARALPTHAMLFSCFFLFHHFSYICMCIYILLPIWVLRFSLPPSTIIIIWHLPLSLSHTHMLKPWVPTNNAWGWACCGSLSCPGHLYCIILRFFYSFDNIYTRQAACSWTTHILFCCFQSFCSLFISTIIILLLLSVSLSLSLSHIHTHWWTRKWLKSIDACLGNCVFYLRINIRQHAILIRTLFLYGKIPRFSPYSAEYAYPTVCSYLSPLLFKSHQLRFTLQYYSLIQHHHTW